MVTTESAKTRSPHCAATITSPTVDIPTADLNYNKELGKIPIGAYRVTAALVEKGGAKRAMTCARTFGVETAGSLDIFWECREHQEDRADPAVYLKD